MEQEEVKVEIEDEETARNATPPAGPASPAGPAGPAGSERAGLEAALAEVRAYHNTLAAPDAYNDCYLTFEELNGTQAGRAFTQRQQGGASGLAVRAPEGANPNAEGEGIGLYGGRTVDGYCCGTPIGWRTPGPNQVGHMRQGESCGCQSLFGVSSGQC